MATVIIRESIHLVRDKKRMEPEIGKTFELTKEEIESLKELRPSESESGSSAFDVPMVIEKEAKPAGKNSKANEL